MSASTITLSHPRQISPLSHSLILEKLNKSLNEFKQTPTAQPLSLETFRVREWWLELQDGRGCLEIYLDKGYPSAELEGGVQPGNEADGAITLDQCAAVHNHFLATDALSDFADDIAIQVGSPGLNPPVREFIDFQASVGTVVDLTTWQEINGRTKYLMLLSKVTPADVAPVLILTEGPHVFEIPLENVKYAIALPEHPFSLKNIALLKSSKKAVRLIKKTKQKR